MHFVPIQDFFHKNMNVIKKKLLLGLQVAAFQHSFPHQSDQTRPDQIRPGKVEKVGKVGKAGQVGKVGTVRKVGKIGKV